MINAEFRCYSVATETFYYSDSCPNMKVFDLVESVTWKVNQYTGLKDFNGKRIFSGDILKNTANKDGRIVEVIFLDGCFMAHYPNHDFTNYLFHWIKGIDALGGKVEIIGNIYETPELLDE